MSARRFTLALIRRRYVERGRPLPEGVEATLRADERAGARAILEAIARRRHDNRAEGQRLRTLLRYERDLWGAGVTLVAGIDEAGYGPNLGPLVQAAVALRDSP